MVIKTQYRSYMQNTLKAPGTVDSNTIFKNAMDSKNALLSLGVPLPFWLQWIIYNQAALNATNVMMLPKTPCF